MSKAEKEFFETVAKKEYDVFPEAFYEEIILKTVEHLQNGSMIIDIGCGSGSWGVRIATKGYVIVGIDISRGMMKNAYRFAKDCREDFFGVCGDAENLPFRDTFDGVFYGFSLHHIPKISSALQEAYRCLKSGGFIILIEPNGSNPIRKLSSIAGKLFSRTKNHHFSSPVERPLNINLICKLLKKYKFESIYVLMDYTTLKNEKANNVVALRDFLLKVASKLFPKPCNAVNFIIVAKKLTCLR